MAIPLKRQLINVDRLPFPSGTATAGTLRTLHTTGGDAIVQAKTLFGCALFAALLNLWVDAWTPICQWIGTKTGYVEFWNKVAKGAFPDVFPLFPGDFAKRLMTHQTISFEGSTIFLAAGALMGIRVGVSLLIGAVVYFGILPPILESQQIIHIDPAKELPLRTISAGWTLWPSVAMMVTSGLMSFGLRWKTIARSFGELTAIFGFHRKQKDPLAHVEAPMWWFLVGLVVSGTACVYFGWLFFNISWWMGAIAVLLTFLLAIIAARATGETDFTPIGAMGKITQLTYGLLAPSNTTINLSTASITGAGACHSADLLVSLKAGYLVGANPRRQVLSQIFGVVAGVLVCIPVYTIIVRMPPFDPAAEKAAAAYAAQAKESGASAAPVAGAENVENATDMSKTNLFKEFPAPSAQIWKSVAELLSEGFENLPRFSIVAMIIAGSLGIVIALTEEFLPRHYLRWLPSATGLGIAGVIQGHQSIALFLGAFAAWMWMKKHPKSGEKFIVSGSSGLIAGESLMGVALKLWEGGPVIARGIWKSIAG
jgi:OPT family oligopeptide transporter